MFLWLGILFYFVCRPAFIRDLDNNESISLTSFFHKNNIMMPYCPYFVHAYPTSNSTSYFWNLTLEYQIESNFLRI
jgi:hypothetical protein